MTKQAVVPCNTLVYDVGMDIGQDTKHYLQRGYKVVAFEANPELVRQNKIRFKDAIKKGDLTIVYGAIVDEKTAQKGTIDFFINKESVWGTVVPARAAEYEDRSKSSARVVKVPCVSFVSALKEYGIPHYIKVDIEGADIVCLEALRAIKQRPAYISLESDVDSYANVRKELELLDELGYTRFQVINQKDIQKNSRHDEYEYAFGASGEFGEWLPHDEWMGIGRTKRFYRLLFVWYKLFAYKGLLRNTPLQAPLSKFLSKMTGTTIPSWHDTHARHKDAV
jgi:FkbM family methyltransferase